MCKRISIFDSFFFIFNFQLLSLFLTLPLYGALWLSYAIHTHDSISVDLIDTTLEIAILLSEKGNPMAENIV